jgi:enoyl-[acyl-carrier protein] reductase I
MCHPGWSQATIRRSAEMPSSEATDPTVAIPTGTLMAGRRGVVMGVANDRSIAWGIARAVAAQGAELCFTYQGEALEKRVRPLAEQAGSSLVLPCDVTDDASVDSVFERVKAEWGGLDFLVHAIGFADKQYLRGRYMDTPREAFLQAMDISVYSFVSVAQRAVPLMKPGGTLLTMSYLGAERVTPHYNVMGVAKAALEASVRYMAADLGKAGIRVNAISAGPIKTLAASGIGDFRYILKWNQYNAPMERNITIEDVGGAGVYLLSSLSSGVTGEVHHVDCGYHVVGMKNPDAPDIATV